MPDKADLEARLWKFLDRLRDRLEDFKPEFFQAGYNGYVPSIIQFLARPAHILEGPFDDLVYEFYRGVQKKLREEKEPFERAFLYFTTSSAFIGLEPDSARLQNAQKEEKEMFGLMVELMHDPDQLRDFVNRSGGNLSGRIAIEIFNQAGAYLSGELERCRHLYTNKSDAHNTLIQKFKGYIDRVIETGKGLQVGHPELLEVVGDPLELLKVVTQNAEKFVRRYAALWGYEMGSR